MRRARKHNHVSRCYSSGLKCRFCPITFQRVRVDDSDTPEAYIYKPSQSEPISGDVQSPFLRRDGSVHVQLIATEAEPKHRGLEAHV